MFVLRFHTASQVRLTARRVETKNELIPLVVASEKGKAQTSLVKYL